MVAVRLLHGHDRYDEGLRPDDPADSAISTSERYSVDELTAIAALRGANGFPGVPPSADPALSPHEAAVVAAAVTRSLVARGVLGTESRAPLPPHSALFAVVFGPEVTCSVQRYTAGDLVSSNAFVLEGLLVVESSPTRDVIVLTGRDADAFGVWLAETTGWSPAAAMRTGLHQISRSPQQIRSLYGALAAGVPTTLEDVRVVDAGRAVASRRGGQGVDLGWITTADAAWVFPNASDVLGGVTRPHPEVTLQTTTDAEMTRAVLRSIRPVAVGR